MGKLHQTNPGVYRPLLNLVEPRIVDPQQICTELAERLTDQYKQNWQSELRETTGKLRTYKLIKEEF